jgi:hypothetical protein
MLFPLLFAARKRFHCAATLFHLVGNTLNHFVRQNPCASWRGKKTRIFGVEYHHVPALAVDKPTRQSQGWLY